MKLLAKLSAIFISSLLLALLCCLLLGIETQPLLAGRAIMTAEKIERAKRVFSQNDPRRLRTGSIVKVMLDQEDLNLALNYFANQYANAIAGLEIEPEAVLIKTTINLPTTPFGEFLNLQIALKQTDKLPELDYVKLGKLRLPPQLAALLLKNALNLAQPWLDFQAVFDQVRRVKFEQRRLFITYQWQTNLPEKFTGNLMSDQDQQRIASYQQRLTEISVTAKRSLDLSQLLPPLFQLATQRSQNGDPVAENCAVILVLTFYVNQIQLDKIIPDSKTWRQPLWRQVNLNGRDDFPKHYLISAMLAAYAGTPLADAVGLFKEIDDSRGGSGFSFNDIAADRAGTRMGELAVANAQRARKLQAFLANATERDIMPITADLPEFMPAAEFMRRFGGTEGLAYQQMMADIEARVAALPINQN
jgi:hypothetical protein